MRRIRIPHDQRGKGVVLHFAEQMQAVEALQIVEAVAALQILHLHFENEVEGRTEHAAKGHDLFGEAADPEIDVFETAEISGVRPQAVQEIKSVRGDLKTAD